MNLDEGFEELRSLSKKLAEKLDTLDPTSKEYETILKHKLEIDNMINEYANTGLKDESSKKDDKTKRLGIWIGLVTAITTLGGKMIFDTWWSIKGFRFEETGTICSKTFKRIIDNFHKK